MWLYRTNYSFSLLSLSLSQMNYEGELIIICRLSAFYDYEEQIEFEGKDKRENFIEMIDLRKKMKMTLQENWLMTTLQKCTLRHHKVLPLTKATLLKLKASLLVGLPNQPWPFVKGNTF